MELPYRELDRWSTIENIYGFQEDGSFEFHVYDDMGEDESEDDEEEMVTLIKWTPDDLPLEK